MSEYTDEIRSRMIGAGDPNQAPITVVELLDLLNKLEAAEQVTEETETSSAKQDWGMLGPRWTGR